MAETERFDALLNELRERDIDQTDVEITGGTISGVTIADNVTTATDPAANAAVTSAITQAFNGVLITLTTTGNDQELAAPTTAAQVKRFGFYNNETSTHSINAIANSITYNVDPGKSKYFVWDGTAWYPTSPGIEELPVKVTQGGTGLATMTDNVIYKGNGTSTIDASSLTDDGTKLSSTNTEFELAASGAPGLYLKDSDCADGDVNAEIYADATDTGSGTEDIDVFFRQQIAGTMTTFLHADADGDLDYSNRNIKTTGYLKDNAYSVHIGDIRASVDKQNSLSSDTTLTDIVPAGCCLKYIVFSETSGNSPTLDLGTSAGGSQVFVNQVITASDLTTVVINKTFSLSSATTLYLNDDDAGSSWNGATVTVYFVMERII